MLRLKSPLSAQIELTDACNQACLHCYNYWRYLETGQRFDADDHSRSFGHFASLLQFLIDKEVRTVTFTGGEPFLRRDILFDLIKMAKEGGLKAGINTNASLIIESDIVKLKEAGADFLLISLLSNTASTHNLIANAETHLPISRAISRLTDANIDIAVNMVVSAHNCDQVYDTAMYVKNLGVKEFSATPVLPCPLAETHASLLLPEDQMKGVLNDLLRAQDVGMIVDVLEPIVHCAFTNEERVLFKQFLNHRSCSAGISDMVISPDGDVRPCILATKSVGNLISEGWDNCWNALAAWCSPELLPAECLTCDSVDLCGGGCRIAALSTSGIINGKDPYMIRPLSESETISPDLYPDVDFGDSTILQLLDNVSIRSEEFGCVIFMGRQFSFVNKDAADFMSFLIKSKIFSIESISRDVGVDLEDLREFMSSLAKWGFVTPQLILGKEEIG